MLATAVDDSDFKIDYKNGLTGVINGRGKVLIPYKEWKILEYKMGIAKVRKQGETTNCNGTWTAYKEGFVNKTGEFIDDFEIDFEFYADSYVGGLVIRQNKSGRTYAEIEADELAEKRRQEQKRKKAEIIRKILHEYEDKMKNRFCVFQDGRLRISR